MPFTVTFTSSVLVAGSVRSVGSTLTVDDPTARMLVDLGVATAFGLTAQTGAAMANLASRVADNVHTAGTKNTFGHSSTTAGLSLAGAASNPSSLVNGDVWLNSSNNILTARSNGMNGQVGAVRAWVNFNGTGTIAIRATYNVSSITDNGAGDYTINFGVALADTNYVWTGVSTGYGLGGGALFGPTIYPTSTAFTTGSGSFTTSSLRILNKATNGADSDVICISVFR